MPLYRQACARCGRQDCQLNCLDRDRPPSRRSDEAQARALDMTRKAARDLAIHQVLAHVEDELGYENGEPSTERPGRWTFSQGAAALSELRTWLLALLCLALASGCAPSVSTGGSGGAGGAGGAAASIAASTGEGGAGGGVPTWSGPPCDPCHVAAGGGGSGGAP